MLHSALHFLGAPRVSSSDAAGRKRRRHGTGENQAATRNTARARARARLLNPQARIVEQSQQRGIQSRAGFSQRDRRADIPKARNATAFDVDPPTKGKDPGRLIVALRVAVKRIEIHRRRERARTRRSLSVRRVNRHPHKSASLRASYGRVDSRPTRGDIAPTTLGEERHGFSHCDV